MVKASQKESQMKKKSTRLTAAETFAKQARIKASRAGIMAAQIQASEEAIEKKRASKRSSSSKHTLEDEDVLMLSDSEIFPITLAELPSDAPISDLEPFDIRLLSPDQCDALGDLAFSNHCDGVPLTEGYSTIQLIIAVLIKALDQYKDPVSKNMLSSFFTRMTHEHRAVGRFVCPFFDLSETWDKLSAFIQHWPNLKDTLDAIDRYKERKLRYQRDMAQIDSDLASSSEDEQPDPFDPKAEAEELSRHARQFHIYHTRFPHMSSILKAFHSEDTISLAKLLEILSESVRSGRNDHISKLKANFNALMRLSDDPLLFHSEFEMKEDLRGYNSLEHTGILIPLELVRDYVKNPEQMAEQLRAGEYEIVAGNFPNFLYHLKTALVYEGCSQRDALFISQKILRVLRLCCHGPVKAREMDVFSVPNTVVRRMGVTVITEYMIFFVIFIIFYVSAGLKEMQEKFNQFDLRKFILHLEEAWKLLGEKRTNEILTWYTLGVFGTDLNGKKPEPQSTKAKKVARPIRFDNDLLRNPIPQRDRSNNDLHSTPITIPHIVKTPKEVFSTQKIQFRSKPDNVWPELPQKKDSPLDDMTTSNFGAEPDHDWGTNVDIGIKGEPHQEPRQSQPQPSFSEMHSRVEGPHPTPAMASANDTLVPHASHPSVTTHANRSLFDTESPSSSPSVFWSPPRQSFRTPSSSRFPLRFISDEITSSSTPPLSRLKPQAGWRSMPLVESSHSQSQNSPFSHSRNSSTTNGHISSPPLPVLIHPGADARALNIQEKKEQYLEYLQHFQASGALTNQVRLLERWESMPGINKQSIYEVGGMIRLVPHQKVTRASMNTPSHQGEKRKAVTESVESKRSKKARRG